MTLQKHLLVSDFYSELYYMLSEDLGKTWTAPVTIPGFAWRKGPDGEIVAVCDVTPSSSPRWTPRPSTYSAPPSASSSPSAAPPP